MITILGAPNDGDGRLLAVAQSRCQLGVELGARFPLMPVVLTGGFGPHFNTTAKPHWEYAELFLVASGLRRVRIIARLSTSNTVEDIDSLLPLISEHQPSALLLVTSDFHAARVSLLASRALGCAFSVLAARTPDVLEFSRWQLDEIEKVNKLLI